MCVCKREWSLTFLGGFVFFRGDGVGREKVHKVFCVSLRKTKCRHEHRQDRYETNDVLQ